MFHRHPSAFPAFYKYSPHTETFVSAQIRVNFHFVSSSTLPDWPVSTQLYYDARQTFPGLKTLQLFFPNFGNFPLYILEISKHWLVKKACPLIVICTIYIIYNIYKLNVMLSQQFHMLLCICLYVCGRRSWLQLLINIFLWWVLQIGVYVLYVSQLKTKIYVTRNNV